MFTRLLAPLKRLISLYIEDAKLTITERLVRILTVLALSFFGALLSFLFLFFLSFGIALELQKIMCPSLAFIAMGGLYLLIFIILIIFRKQLIINPIARLLSREILKQSSPKNEDDEN